jgi:hypothetical protein
MAPFGSSRSTGRMHIDKVREFLGADKYDAIDIPEA